MQMTAADVVRKLRERYPSGDRFVLMTEVAFGTGTPPYMPCPPITDSMAPVERRAAMERWREARMVRRLDVLVMPCWPSDCGTVERHFPAPEGAVVRTEHRRPGPWGFEIKVHRSDWLREMANPVKARPWIETCQRFYFAAAPGVIRWGEVERVFPTVGWIEVGSRVTVRREAVVNEGAADATMAAIVRAAWKAGLEAGRNGERDGG